mmetsp:Transcript_80857/g.223663  ORF Transcript_80857/g.223663 Transcript_80857/m.223663 type:complete len:327 (-) Transcript_80857:921-1901(-)
MATLLIMILPQRGPELDNWLSRTDLMSHLLRSYIYHGELLHEVKDGAGGRPRMLFLQDPIMGTRRLDHFQFAKLRRVEVLRGRGVVCRAHQQRLALERGRGLVPGDSRAEPLHVARGLRHVALKALRGDLLPLRPLLPQEARPQATGIAPRSRLRQQGLQLVGGPVLAGSAQGAGSAEYGFDLPAEPLVTPDSQPCRGRGPSDPGADEQQAERPLVPLGLEDQAVRDGATHAGAKNEDRARRVQLRVLVDPEEVRLSQGLHGFSLARLLVVRQRAAAAGVQQGCQGLVALPGPVRQAVHAVDHVDQRAVVGALVQGLDAGDDQRHS